MSVHIEEKMSVHIEEKCQCINLKSINNQSSLDHVIDFQISYMWFIESREIFLYWATSSMRKNMQLLDLTLAHKNPTRTGNVMDIFICNKSVATLPYTLNIDLTCAVQLFFRESHQVLAFNIVGPKVQPSATVANCITYNITVMQYNAGPAWWGYTLVDDRARVNGFFCHQQRNSAHRSLIA